MKRTLPAIPAKDKDWEDILGKPHYFLYGVDFQNSVFQFLESSRTMLSEPSFIDGRVALSDKEILLEIPFDVALSWHNEKSTSARASNFIFHIGFCGSTLLARGLDVQGKSFSYKEPQTLISIADRHPLSDEHEKEFNHSILEFVLEQYNTPWIDGEVNVIKPSNWINSMLPFLMEREKPTKALFLSSEPIDFLIAVFRGGESRLNYLLRFLEHMCYASTTLRGFMTQAKKESKNEVEYLIKLTLLAHILQEKIIAKSSATLSKENKRYYSYQQLVGNPKTILSEASDLFDVKLTDQEIGHSIEKNFEKHSKSPDRKYDSSEMKKVDQQVVDYYADDFKNGLDWHSQALEKWQ